MPFSEDSLIKKKTIVRDLTSSQPVFQEQSLFTLNLLNCNTNNAIWPLAYLKTFSQGWLKNNPGYHGLSKSENWNRRRIGTTYSENWDHPLLV